MHWALLISMAMCIVILMAWQKAKADISFLEGKAFDFLMREEHLEQEVEMLKARLIQRQDTSFRPAAQNYADPLHSDEPYHEMYTVMDLPEPPQDLEVTEIGEIQAAFLKKLGVDLNHAELELETFHAIPQIEEQPEESYHFEQPSLFEEIEIAHISSAPSLNKNGLYFWKGTIVQKFGEDFSLISNGTHQYHFSTEKLHGFQVGDPVDLHVLVNDRNKEVVNVWLSEKAAITA
jgi:hypothetical protein